MVANEGEWEAGSPLGLLGSRRRWPMEAFWKGRSAPSHRLPWREVRPCRRSTAGRPSLVHMVWILARAGFVLG